MVPGVITDLTQHFPAVRCDASSENRRQQAESACYAVISQGEECARLRSSVTTPRQPCKRQLALATHCSSGPAGALQPGDGRALRYWDGAPDTPGSSGSAALVSGSSLPAEMEAPRSALGCGVMQTPTLGCRSCALLAAWRHAVRSLIKDSGGLSSARAGLRFAGRSCQDPAQHPPRRGRDPGVRCPPRRGRDPVPTPAARTQSAGLPSPPPAPRRRADPACRPPAGRQGSCREQRGLRPRQLPPPSY